MQKEDETSWTHLACLSLSLSQLNKRKEKKTEKDEAEKKQTEKDGGWKCQIRTRESKGSLLY